MGAYAGAALGALPPRPGIMPPLGPSSVGVPAAAGPVAPQGGLGVNAGAGITPLAAGGLGNALPPSNAGGFTGLPPIAPPSTDEGAARRTPAPSGTKAPKPLDRNKLTYLITGGIVVLMLGAAALALLLLTGRTNDPAAVRTGEPVISIDPVELRQLIEGSDAIAQALGGEKVILPEEQVTIDFAYACVVTTRAIAAGEPLSRDNTWVKRPGTGEIKAASWEGVLGRVAARPLEADVQVAWADLG
jgi:hypothetical protein